MNLRSVLSIFTAKLAIRACRLFNRGGTSLPGKIALKIYPDILRVLASNFKIIMVTGTNGKTTTSRIIGQILKENNIDYITNKSGANLFSGITTTFIDAVDISGRSSIATALIEADEAAFKIVSRHIEPAVLVVTNFFRDQLDRYGELYSTLNAVKSGIENNKNTKLVINADDSLAASLGRDVPNSVTYYGFNENAHSGSDDGINTDAVFCIFCKARYVYKNHVYGHLGGFACPDCGYTKPETQVTCTNVEELTSTYSSISFTMGDSDFSAKISLPGLYNIYNAMAAAACSHVLGLPSDSTVIALGSFECGFGRMETIDAGNKFIRVILVKNPTGFNQVLNYLITEDKSMQIAFVINDKLADGTDISWLWDVDFEKLHGVQEKIENIFTSGIRAEDMSVRLKYAGIYTNKISLIKNYDELISKALSKTPEGHSLYILPTYTAMLDIRKALKKRFGLKEFWR